MNEDYHVTILSALDGILELNVTRRESTEYVKINTGLDFTTATNVNIRDAIRTYLTARDAAVVAQAKAAQAAAVALVGKTIDIIASAKADQAFDILHPVTTA